MRNVQKSSLSFCYRVVVLLLLRAPGTGAHFLKEIGTPWTAQALVTIYALVIILSLNIEEGEGLLQAIVSIIIFVTRPYGRNAVYWAWNWLFLCASGVVAGARHVHLCVLEGIWYWWIKIPVTLSSCFINDATIGGMREEGPYHTW